MRSMNEIVLKTHDEHDLMRVSGRLLASVFAYLDPLIKPGLSTMKIKDLVEDFITNTLNARPSVKGNTTSLLFSTRQSMK